MCLIISVALFPSLHALISRSPAVISHLGPSPSSFPHWNPIPLFSTELAGHCPVSIFLPHSAALVSSHSKQTWLRALGRRQQQTAVRKCLQIERDSWGWLRNNYSKIEDSGQDLFLLYTHWCNIFSCGRLTETDGMHHNRFTRSSGWCAV